MLNCLLLNCIYIELFIYIYIYIYIYICLYNKSYVYNIYDCQYICMSNEYSLVWYSGFNFGWYPIILSRI